MSTIIDLSNNNGGPIDFGAVKRAGVAAVYLKATEGNEFVDHTFAARRVTAAAHGLHVGAYHFARTKNTPTEDAAHFCGVVGAVKTGEMLPALDLETNDAGLGSAHLVEWAREFNRHVHDRLGYWPLFYSYRAFVYGLAATAPIGGGLWLADYGPDDGHVHPVEPPPPWKRIKLHQYTSKGSVRGVSGGVDVSVGTLTGIVVRDT